MNNPGAAQVAWAKQLLAAEGNSGDKAEECAAAAWRVYERLNARLSPLLGSAGSQSLMVRSAKLAQAEFACLVEVAAPEGLTKLGTCLQSLEPAIATETAATLFGTFIDLITTFIGERLTVLVLRSAWPAIEETAPTETKT
jgi:hypothetical protein